MKLTRLHHKIYKILQVIQNRAVYQNHRFTQDSFWPIFPFVVVGRDFAPIRRPWCRRNGGQTSSHYWDCSAFYPLKHLETTECDVGDVGGLWSLIPSSLPQLHQLSNRLNPFTRLQAKPFLRKEVRIFPIAMCLFFVPTLTGFWQDPKKMVRGGRWVNGLTFWETYPDTTCDRQIRWTTWETNVRCQ